jgi:ABC-type Na+ efflux pump permease subunit
MLINPNQIAIDNKIIISYNAKKSFIGWFAVAILLIIIACLYFIYLSFKTYKKNLYLYDKEIGSKSKWQLFLVWLKD